MVAFRLGPASRRCRGAPCAGRLLAFAAVAALAVAGCRLEDRDPAEDASLPALDAHPPEVAQPEPPPEPEPEPPTLEVGDDFWWGPETMGVEFVATFPTREALALHFDLEQPIAVIDGRDWTLADVLVAVEFRGPGERAVWRVAGPPDVVTAYARALRDRAPDRSLVRDLGVLPMRVRHYAGAPERRIIPQPE